LSATRVSRFSRKMNSSRSVQAEAERQYSSFSALFCRNCGKKASFGQFDLI